MRNQELAQLEARAGIIFPGAMDFLPRDIAADGTFGRINEAAFDKMLAMDAQPSLITAPNAGIPAMFTTYVDPRLITVLTTPNKAEEIYGSTKKGDWLTETAMFPMVESTGEVSSYGDFSENGRAGANVQYENRQSYAYQVFTEWGEREMERMGLGRVDWAARLNIASALTLSKAANFYAFYGVAGLQNYGALNDPSLSSALTPITKAATGTSWSVATPTEIVADIQKAFAALQSATQTNGNLELTSPLTLALHPVSETYLVTPNSFGLNAMELLKKTFPGLKIKNAVQFLSGTTYSFQMFADSVDGQPTVESCFTEKMRAHPVITAASSWKQKKSQGTWGTIWYFPAGVVSMAGI